MLLRAEDLQSNLKRLREAIVSARCCDTAADHESTARRAADVMPLCHSTSAQGLSDAIEAGALLSNEQRGAKSRRADIALNGTNEICFYLGSAAFPDNQFGFLFSNTLTDDVRGSASATPFDSGGCVSRYQLPPGTDPFDHVRVHSMPVPECRHYLGDLLASHFDDPVAYLAGRPFACPACMKPLVDPHGMTAIDDHGLVRMHEVRIPERVELKTPSLIALFTPQGNVQPYLAPLIASGVDLIPYDDQDGKDRDRALRRASVDYILGKFLN